ncbi:MAG TPA: hypothetical protein VE575_05820 [Acidimicrobiales bacterium]|nr:hypothetical protein [Acidimicrobiales bacterium]
MDREPVLLGVQDKSLEVDGHAGGPVGARSEPVRPPGQQRQAGDVAAR